MALKSFRLYVNTQVPLPLVNGCLEGVKHPQGFSFEMLILKVKNKKNICIKK